MALTKASEYDIAVGALALVLLAANFILWVITLLKCRRRGDPSRRGLSWMKLCAPLYSGYVTGEKEKKHQAQQPGMVHIQN